VSLKRGDQGVEDVGDGAADGVGFGQRPQVRLVAGWIGLPVAPEFPENRESNRENVREF
jgi:hypothetical protein